MIECEVSRTAFRAVKACQLAMFFGAQLQERSAENLKFGHQALFYDCCDEDGEGRR